MNNPQPPSRNEEIKARSNFLRGTLKDAFDETAFGGLPDDDGQLIKFHGMYVQDDRDLRPERMKRKLDRAYSFMARLRIPGGVLTPRQYHTMDRLAEERANGTIRVTTRQTIQLHGILKSNVRAVLQEIDTVLLDTIAACGDVNRNVIATANPFLSRAHAEAVEAARQLSAHFLPRTGAWREIFIGDRRVLGGDPEVEPIYGSTYLPRKFKIAVAVPPSNDVDVFAHDLSFIAIVENGRITGYNVVVGGGMGASHGEPETYPRTGTVIGYVAADHLVPTAEAVLTLQRDYGDRSNRKHARLKYTIDDRGVDWFIRELASRMTTTLETERPFHFDGNGDAIGWTTDTEGFHHRTLFIENGRIADQPGHQLRTALRAIAVLPEFIDRGAVVLTTNQNVVLARATDAERARIDAILAEAGVDSRQSVVRENAMACVALPTCGLALAESERFLPGLIDEIDELLKVHGLETQKITLRMTGCPNGCARPYIAEIGLIGRNPGRYNLHVGGAADGSRLNRLLRENADGSEILSILDRLFARYAAERSENEGFGDFVQRVNVWA